MTRRLPHLLALVLLAACRDTQAPVTPGGTDQPAAIGLTMLQGGVASDEPVDIEGSATFHADVRGGGGRPLAGVAVEWSCAGRDALWVRCDSVLVPRLQHLARPETLTVTARAAGLAATMRVVVHEANVGTFNVSWAPAPYLVGDTTYFAQTAEVTLGDTLRLRVRAVGASRVGTPPNQYYPYLVRRPLRFVLDDGTLASVTLGDSVDGSREVKVAGLRAGTTRMRVLVNGGAAGFNLRVGPRASTSCASPIGLDLALGEVRTVRGSDASQCLRFDRARDAGRVYLLVSDALPLESSVAPTANVFDIEGQGLFFRSGSLVPRAKPVLRIYAPGSPAPSTPELRASASDEVERGAWHVGGQELREHPPVLTRAPSVLGATQLAVPTVALGDTIALGGLAYFDQTLRTVDGAPVDERAVVVHVGQRLVAAELVDVLRGRLRNADGSATPRIPAAVLSELEGDYVVPSRQLARLFPGTPVQRQAWGRDFGTRELFVNVPLAAGFGGYATPDYVAGDFAVFGGLLATSRYFIDQVLTHEFAHMRQMSRYWPTGPSAPWQVEGVANFAQRLAMTARTTGSDAPSRTARFTQIGDANLTPGVFMHHTNSFFQGYDRSSYALDYLVDHAEAAGRDGLAAVRGLVSASSSAAADAAVGAALPGIGAQDMIVRARVALALEELRDPKCSDCIRPDASLPDWTRYLQYDVNAVMASFRGEHTLGWPVLRPGASGVAWEQRTGAFWPMLLDGRDAASDATWVLDFERAPQTTVSVVRIR